MNHSGSVFYLLVLKGSPDDRHQIEGKHNSREVGRFAHFTALDAVIYMKGQHKAFIFLLNLLDISLKQTQFP